TRKKVKPAKRATEMFALRKIRFENFCRPLHGLGFKNNPFCPSNKESVSEPRAVATGSSSFAELLDPIATAPGSDTSFDTLSKSLGYFHLVRRRGRRLARLLKQTQ